MVKTLEQENVAKMLEEEEDSNSSMKNGLLNTSMEEEADTESIEIARPVDQIKVQTYDKDTFNFTVFVMVKKLTFIQIEFMETGFTTEFKTDDEAFLKQQNVDSNNQLFVWRVKTKALLDSSRCTFKSNPFKMEIYLYKKEAAKWDCLEFNSDDNLPGAPDRSKQKIVKPANRIQNGNSIKDLCNSPLVEPGLVGLKNLGNSCFMNSILQCLSHVKDFREFFLSEKYKEDINVENVLGFKGRLANTYAELQQMLWSGTSPYISPFKMKQLIAQTNNQFQGYLQQDAQELMTFLMDGLHEDLNRVKDKPYGNLIESDGKSDEQVALESWLNYKKRNDSILVDLFQGQYKSVLICHDCGTVSTTFDPFSYLQLPLPKDKVRMPVIFFSKSLPLQPLKLNVWLDLVIKGEALKKIIALKTGTQAANLRIIEIYKHSIAREFEDSEDVSLNQNIQLHAFEMCKNPALEINVIQRIAYSKSVEKCSFCLIESTNLKRCTFCLSVAYCDKECQANHWPVHKNECKFHNMPVGQPFKLGLEKSQLHQLYDILETYAKTSVSVYEYSTEAESKPNLGKGDSSPDMEEEEEETNPTNSNSKKEKPFEIYYKAKSSPDEFTRLESLEELDLEEKEFNVILDWKSTSPPIQRVVNSKTLDSEELEDDTIDPNKEATLDQCLQSYTESENLCSLDAWYCPKCKCNKEATKRLTLWKLPKFLIIQFKRFSFNCVVRKKIEKPVSYPVKGLNLNDYACKPSQQLYDLVGVVNHSGILNYGHYTAQAMAQPDKWYNFDDHCVSPLDSSNIISKDAYILFYRCRDIPS